MMHPALRKSPLFLQKNTPYFPLFLQRTPPFSTFLQPPFSIFCKQHLMSFPAYGPVVVYKLSWSVVVVLPISSVCILALLVHA